MQKKVLEFANATFAADLEDKKLSANKAQKELLRLESQTQAESAEKSANPIRIVMISVAVAWTFPEGVILKPSSSDSSSSSQSSSSG